VRVPIRKPDKRTQQKTDPRITEEKFSELKNKLEQLKSRRIRAAHEVQELSEGGDFSENAGYQSAKANLRSLNQRILDIEKQLKQATIITAPPDTSVVHIGHRVTIDLDGRLLTFQILGSAEANPGTGIISHSSPIGAALLGHRVGDTVAFQPAAKLLTCRIVNIE